MENSPRPTIYMNRIDLNFQDETFRRIQETVTDRSGFSLGSYKDKCIKRRIAIRMRANRCSTPEEYCKLLQNDQEEVELLLKVLTIHVTQFFRNPSTFQKLKDEIIPYLFTIAENDDRKTLRLWSVGCASGEEPYTLALILRNSFAEEMEKTKVSILGTDVDPAILETARQATYDPERLSEVSQKMKERYFDQVGRKYRLLPETAQMVSFETGDLLRLDSYGESDLILCRNVLIYLDRNEQEKVLKGFADALRPGGVLLLGKSETLVSAIRPQFTVICPVERLYRKR